MLSMQSEQKSNLLKYFIFFAGIMGYLSLIVLLISINIQSKQLDKEDKQIWDDYIISGDIIVKDGVLVYVNPDIKPRLCVSEDVSVIGQRAFQDSQLSEIVLSDKIVEIQDNAFENCDNLDTILIPKSVNTLGGHLFDDCDNLNEVQFSNTGLKSVTIPSSVSVMDGSAFNTCTSYLL